MPFPFTSKDLGAKSDARGSKLLHEKKYPEAEQELRKAVSQRMDKPGPAHASTLESKHSLAHALHQQAKYDEAEKFFREAVRGREKTCGLVDKQTLRSKHWLALTLYKQTKFNEAEKYFREALLGREDELGYNDENTLASRHSLALALYQQGKHNEAEEGLRLAVLGREAVCGLLDEQTLRSTHWLAVTLYDQAKYGEAEPYLRKALSGRESALGHDHKDSLASKQYLALTLYSREQFSEAEQCLRELVLKQGPVLGHSYKDTLQSKHFLALSLHSQKKYREAETYYREALQGREETLGNDHMETLSTTHCLALLLLKEKRYGEAEDHFRRAIIGREKVLGKDDVSTLQSKHDLARSLWWHGKFAEAEYFCHQALLGRQKVLGHDHKNTITSQEWLDVILQSLREREQPEVKASTDDLKSVNSKDVQVGGSGDIGDSEPPQHRTLSKTPPTVLINGGVQELTQHLDDFFIEGKAGKSTYNDSEISTISRLLAHHNPEWSKAPRVYIVLRKIECLHLLNSLLDSGFTDYWFPVTAAGLPAVLDVKQKSDFIRAQGLILTQTLNLEKGADGEHCYLGPDETLPFERQRILGRGGFGQVDEVLSTVSYRKYARKRVLRKTVLRGRRPEHLKLFVSEIETMKRLQHKHIVQFVGSYSDTKYLGLLMRPVAEMDLSVYLTRPDMSSRLGELRTFFGCLAAALDYLHTQSVRHKDIKPENILIDHGNVMFTDFGLSHDFADAQVSTTVSMVNGLTPRYCAPEVAMCEPRDRSSDIWSLGVVYLEMLVTLKGLTSEYMSDYFLEHGTQQPFVRTNRKGFVDLIEHLKTVGSRADNRVIDWINDMLQDDVRERPHAGLLVATINDMSKHEYGSKGFCGICCLPQGEDDGYSDFSD